MISTVIVTKNDRARITTTLTSLTSQTGVNANDWEIVIVDGGSDDLQTFLIEFESLPIKYFASSDSGIYDAMNKGTDLSRGDFLHFLNCGDLLYDDSILSKTISCIGSGEKDLYFWNYLVIGSHEVVKFSDVTAFSILTYKNGYCHQAQIIRRELLLSLGYNLEFLYCADYLTTLKILSIGESCTLDFLGVFYEPGGFSDNKFTEIVLEKRKAFSEFNSFLSTINKKITPLEFIQAFLWNLSPQLTKILHRFLR